MHSAGGEPIYRRLADSEEKFVGGGTDNSDMLLQLAETGILRAMRLDPCSGIGEVRFDAIQLKDTRGNTLKQWP